MWFQRYYRRIGWTLVRVWIEKLRNYFQEIRLNFTYDTLYTNAENISNQMNIPVNFYASDAIRSLRSLRYHNGENENVDLHSKYRADFFNFIIDSALISLNERNTSF